MADMIEMNNEGKIKGEKYEVVYLQKGCVTCSGKEMEKFVTEWLNDVADLGDENDDAKLTFPEGL